jgi:protease I
MEATMSLRGIRVAFLTANEGVERAELEQPWHAVLERGGTAELIAPSSGRVQSMDHLDKSATFPVDATTGDVRAEDYGAVVLPGGVANPDQLRMDEPAVAFLRAMFESGRPAAVICHGPWTLVEAGLVKGRTLTSWPSVKTDIRNAGGNWVDQEVQVCTAGPNVLVSSRKPDDLPAFCKTFVQVFEQHRVGAS